jgi:hypothetical protein
LLHNKEKSSNMNGREMRYDDKEPIANDTHLFALVESSHNTDYRAYKLLGVHLDGNLRYNNHMHKLSNPKRQTTPQRVFNDL